MDPTFRISFGKDRSPLRLFPDRGYMAISPAARFRKALLEAMGGAEKYRAYLDDLARIVVMLPHPRGWAMTGMEQLKISSLHNCGIGMPGNDVDVTREYDVPGRVVETLGGPAIHVDAPSWLPSLPMAGIGIPRTTTEGSKKGRSKCLIEEELLVLNKVFRSRRNGAKEALSRGARPEDVARLILSKEMRFDKKDDLPPTPQFIREQLTMFRRTLVGDCVEIGMYVRNGDKLGMVYNVSYSRHRGTKQANGEASFVSDGENPVRVNFYMHLHVVEANMTRPSTTWRIGQCVPSTRAAWLAARAEWLAERR